MDQREALDAVAGRVLKHAQQHWIKGRWVEKEGDRRRCYYTLTSLGAEALASQKKEWKAFSAMVNRVIGPEPVGA